MNLVDQKLQLDVTVQVSKRSSDSSQSLLIWYKASVDIYCSGAYNRKSFFPHISGSDLTGLTGSGGNNVSPSKKDRADFRNITISRQEATMVSQ